MHSTPMPQATIDALLYVDEQLVWDGVPCEIHHVAAKGPPETTSLCITIDDQSSNRELTIAIISEGNTVNSVALTEALSFARELQASASTTTYPLDKRGNITLHSPDLLELCKEIERLCALSDEAFWDEIESQINARKRKLWRVHRQTWKETLKLLKTPEQASIKQVRELYKTLTGTPKPSEKLSVTNVLYHVPKTHIITYWVVEGEEIITSGRFQRTGDSDEINLELLLGHVSKAQKFICTSQPKFPHEAVPYQMPPMRVYQA